jgi:L-alanine-DL-glutamate epimerase-like enolase superfamily enzyme
VFRLLGARYRDRVKAYASILTPETPEEACARARESPNAGFLAMKFGWGPIGKSADLDRRLFQAVREGAGPAIEIMIDAGQSYDWQQARRASEWLAAIGATWLEEPLDPDDLDGYARLASRSAVSIAAGESESGVPAFRRLVEHGQVDIVQPDLPHAYKSNVLLAASLHYCAATPSAALLEYSVSSSPIRRTLVLPDLPVVDGYVGVPQTPGLGIEVNLDVVEELSARALHPAVR